MASVMTPALGKAQEIPAAKNVVLVHGLYADGSSWLEVFDTCREPVLR